MNKIILNAFKDKTKYFIYTMLLLFIIILFIIIILINNYYQFYTNDIFGSKEENRTLIVKGYDDNIIYEFKKNNYIEKYFANYNSLVFNEEKEDNFDIDSIVDNEENPDTDLNNKKVDSLTVNIYNDEEIIKGRNNIKNNEVIISQYYYILSSLTNDDINKSKEISLYLNGELYTFKIIGTTYENKTDIYISRDLFEKINKNMPVSYNVIVDRYINLDKVISNLKDKEYDVSLYSSHIEIKNINIIQKIFSYVLLIGIVIIFIALYFMIKDMFTNEEKNLAVLKSIGYKDNQLIYIIFVRIMLILLLSMTLFFGFYILFKNMIKFILNNNNVILFVNSFNIYKYLMLLLIIFLVIIIINSLLYKKKIRNMNVFKILDSE